jgi:hypothetical protein
MCSAAHLLSGQGPPRFRILEEAIGRVAEAISPMPGPGIGFMRKRLSGEPWRAAQRR